MAEGVRTLRATQRIPPSCIWPFSPLALVRIQRSRAQDRGFHTFSSPLRCKKRLCYNIITPRAAQVSKWLDWKCFLIVFFRSLPISDDDIAWCREVELQGCAPLQVQKWRRAASVTRTLQHSSLADFISFFFLQKCFWFLCGDLRFCILCDLLATIFF